MADFNENIVNRHASSREGSDYWAELPAVIAAWKSQTISQVMPAALELAPVLACNLACKECPYGPLRRAMRLPRVKRGCFVVPDDTAAMTLNTAELVLDRAADAGVKAVLVTGVGEPTLSPDLVSILRYSAERGMLNALYTNAIQIGVLPELSLAILDPRNSLVFVRTSLNVATEEVGRLFAGEQEADIDAQFRGFATLVTARDLLRPRYVSRRHRLPGISVSVICDQQNISDVPQIVARVADAAIGRTVVEPNDDVVVRLLTKHCRPTYSTTDHDESVVKQLLACAGRGRSGRRLLEAARLNVRLGFGLDRVDSGDVPSYSALLDAEYSARDRCWANGLFLTVGPNAKVYLCTDRNGYPEWEVGDLKRKSVAEIYNSLERAALLEKVHKEHCGLSVCEATCRASRLNGIACAIQAGELTNTEIEEIRQRSASARPVLLS